MEPKAEVVEVGMEDQSILELQEKISSISPSEGERS
jgi:hypothetical protein